MLQRSMFLLIISFLYIKGEVTHAQDTQYSQFYAAPLYLNPAFAGSTGRARIGINYRNQWPAISSNFSTISAFFDMYIEDINSGIGAFILHDQEGILGLQSINFAVQYSYNLNITKWLALRTGFQAELFYRSINFNKLTFGDQFDPATGQVISSTSAEGLGSGGATFFPSITGGILLYSKNAWVGVSTHHITEPNQSFLGEQSKLPLKISAHIGFRIPFKSGVKGSGIYSRPAERSITPTFQYRHQDTFDNLDLGLYCTLEPVVFGVWYKGVPFRTLNNFNNHESIVFLLGFIKKGSKDTFRVGYSYDYTISTLGFKSGGAHEVSLSYSWSTRDPRKPSKDKLIIPCPDF